MAKKIITVITLVETLEEPATTPTEEEIANFEDDVFRQIEAGVDPDTTTVRVKTTYTEEEETE